MRVLLTGAAGFVGSQVARALVARGHDVDGVARGTIERLEGVRPALRLHRCDVTDEHDVQRLVDATRPEACIHCAWYAAPGKYLHAPENEHHRRAGLALARALAAAGCRRFVGVGTCVEYADSRQPLSESSPLGPTTPYGASKLGLYDDLQCLAEETGVEVAWARVFYLYGPFEDPRRLVPAVTLALLAGNPARTTEGRQVRDFVDVEDVATALVTLLEASAGGAFNVATGRAVSVRDLVLLLGKIIGRPDLIQLGARPQGPGERAVVAATGMRLVEELGWAPRPLEDGLRETVEWWKARL